MPNAGKGTEGQGVLSRIRNREEGFYRKLSERPLVRKFEERFAPLEGEGEGPDARGGTAASAQSGAPAPASSSSDSKSRRHLDGLNESRRQIDDNESRSWFKRELRTPIASKKLPIGVKVLGLLCMLATFVMMFNLVDTVLAALHLYEQGDVSHLGTSTVVVLCVFVIDLFLLDLAFLAFGVMLFSGRRVFAALLVYALYVLLLVGAVCSLMLYGAKWQLLSYGIVFAVLVAMQSYLDPYLREERQLQRLLRDNELRHEKEDGVLGRDLTGKGFIELNFFNLFWIFVVCSIIGDGMESVFHVVVVDPGHWQDRAGLLYGPFSPIYGCGALIMTLCLNRFYKANFLVIFLVAAVLGGAFEYVVSYWMQYTYGAVAWDYTGEFLSIGGRTCGWAMACWGGLGVVWIKLLLPVLLWLINKIPWNLRYTITLLAASLMAVDVVMTLQALDCWYERLAGNPVDTNIQRFYSQYYDDGYMQNRFQSMSIDPSATVREAH